MQIDDVIRTVAETLRETVPAVAECSDLVDRPLADLGISSVDMVSLVFAIEARLGIVFQDDQLTAELFSTCRNIGTVAAGLLSQKVGAGTAALHARCPESKNAS